MVEDFERQQHAVNVKCIALFGNIWHPLQSG